MDRLAFQKHYGYTDEQMKRIDIIYKLFHGQKLTVKDYAWIGSELRNREGVVHDRHR